jgi:hypothetical protein
MNWDAYEPFQPGFHGAPNELARKDAKKAFDLLISSRGERIAALGRLLEANGLSLDPSDEGLQRLNDWFRANVEGDPESGRPRNLWYAVVNDLGLYLGEVIIERAPALHWDFFTRDKHDLCYQRHVISGFAKVPNPRFYVDTDLPQATYASRVVRGWPVEPNHFVRLVNYAVAMAQGGPV